MNLQILLTLKQPNSEPQILLNYSELNDTRKQVDLPQIISGLYFLEAQNYIEIIRDKIYIGAIFFTFPHYSDPTNFEKGAIILIAPYSIRTVLKIESLMETLQSQILSKEKLSILMHSKSLQPLEDLLHPFYQNILIIANRKFYGNLLLVGQSLAGKTTVLHRLKDGIFNPNIRPTIGHQVVNTFLNQMNFRIYDLGGQKKYQSTWSSACKNPNGIIYVTDLNKLEENAKKDSILFSRILEQYLLHRKESSDKSIPVLILGNKIDLIPSGQRVKISQKLYQIFKIDSYSFKINLGIVSALTNEGISQNFKWLISELLRSEIYASNFKKSDYKLTPKNLSDIDVVYSHPDPFQIIRDLWVFTKEGIELFSHISQMSYKSTFLFSFQKIMQSFSKKVERENYNAMVIGQNRYSFYGDIERNYYLLARSPKKVEELVIKSTLEHFFELFHSAYHESLLNFKGDVSPFKFFDDFLTKNYVPYNAKKKGT